MDKFLGTLLDNRYQIESVVGEGGMATVYKAWDEVAEKYVAVKILKEEFAKDFKFRKKFQNESKAIGILSNKNIVEVTDVSFTGEYNYIVMELINGRTLKEIIDEKAPLNVSEAISYGGQILGALKHAHDKGIVHRDVKPQNIMVLDDGTVKVTDFGIASFVNYDTATITDKAIGTVHYISPEQAKGLPVDCRSDLYSLGIIFYEMLTGKLPFDGDSAVAVALKQVRELPVRPTELRPSLPLGLEQIILKAMQKDPDDRYSSAKEMRKDLIAFINDNNVVFPYVFNYPDPADIAKSPTQIIPAVKDAAKKKTAKKKGLFAIKNTLLKNRLIASVTGVSLAFILVLLGLWGMYASVRGFNSSLVDVPTLVGRSIDEVKADSKLNTDFKIVEANPQYDAAVEAGYIISQDPTTGTYETGKQITVTVSLGTKTVSVPNVYNKKQDIALLELKQADLKTEVITEFSSTVETGCVIRTSPEVGTSIAAGSTIKVYISVESSDEKMVKVPNVEGKNLATAKRELEKQGLVVIVVEEENSSVSAGTVISQSLEGLSEVESGTEITITVSKG